MSAAVQMEPWQRAWLTKPNDPLAFTEQVLGVTGIEPWQREALIALGKHDRISIRAGHGVGKTAFECWAILWFMCSRYPFKIPVTANSQDQLRDVVWAELRKWATRLPAPLYEQLDIQAERIVWPY